MTNKFLIGIATYRESGNVKTLIQEIISHTNENVDILIVDDDSPDGTAKLVEEMQSKYQRVQLVKRKGKFGLGSAHKRILQYAIVNGYAKLITMDADFSHSPQSINSLLAVSTDDNFVIGSRYASGGKCDYTGYRKYISIFGNMVARKLLRISSKEVTTSFRVYSKKILNSINLSSIRSDSYSFFVEVLHALNQQSFSIIEVPIHFKDRKHNKSKIPKLQILNSMVNLLILWLGVRSRKETAALNISKCRACRAVALLPLERYSGHELKPFKLSSSDFNCSSVFGSKIQPSLYSCLDCSLVQIPANESVDSPMVFYENVTDTKYIDKIDIKYRTFERAFNLIYPHIFYKKTNNPDFEILDVGSYYGAFLKILELGKVKATGVEPCVHACNYSLSNCSQHVENKSLSEYAKKSNKTFHLITSWDVIEHCVDVNIFLKEISMLLKDDGVFVFSTIFIDSLFAKIAGRYWPWILPMHLSYFNKDFIDTVLRDNNLKQVSVSNHIHYSQISYALRGFSNKLPLKIKLILQFFIAFVPEKWIVPFGFGDVKIIVAKKDKVHD
jgi:dolichol-phosphate mannosyltransferase